MHHSQIVLFQGIFLLVQAILSYVDGRDDNLVAGVETFLLGHYFFDLDLFVCCAYLYPLDLD